MNFLAHLLLSGENRAVQAGNLFGDEIKGRDYSYLPREVARGVTLHRFIDNHTDTSELNLELKKALYPYFHKYAGVALDIYFDHFLSRHWAKFSEISLELYAEDVYTELKPYVEFFSFKSERLFLSMTKHRYLAKYGELNGMNVVFGEMQKILPNNAGMENAVEALEMHYELIENGFIEYFPILLTDSQHKLLDLLIDE
mgnify:FL=1|jgi:acyl carrier protein phosphodiesterase